MLNDNRLDAVDALLGCPVLFYSPSAIEEFVFLKDKEPVCLSIFYAINWFRELVNAFSIEQDDETRSK